MSGEVHDFVVVGGGIAGLATAYEILRIRPKSSLIVLEATERLGGNIRTTRDDGFTVEWGVNGFLDNVPETLDLVARIGLAGDLLPAARAAGRRFIFRDGRLREVPLKPTRFLLSDLLTLRGRLRVLGEPFAPRRSDADETVFDFAARRIGPEAAEILVDAMVSGVYAGDSRGLSLASTFPLMREMEEGHGSLVRAMIAVRKKARRERGAGGGPAGPGGVLTSFRGGMDMLIARLAERVGMGRIRLSAPVESVERLPSPGGYRLRIPPAGHARDTLDAWRLIVAAPARSAASFLAPLDPRLADELAAVEYAPVAVVAFAYREEDLAEIPNGFGFLAPHGQGLRILGCLWDSSIFPPRAPEGAVLLRGMIGGACDRDAVALSDADLTAVMRHDLAIAMGISAVPRRIWIFRHPLGIPQYTLGHGARLQRIAARLAPLPGLDLIGNSYRGVAVNHCAKEAAALALGIHDAVHATLPDGQPTVGPPVVPSRAAPG
jgi:oxygen-dependent protoporphyrinogen oxidase